MRWPSIWEWKGIILLFLLTIHFIIVGQDLRFRKFTMEEGLSHNSALCVLEDHNGFMWIGTRGGLNKYNSSEIASYKYEIADSLSISNNHINCIFETRQNELWIGTANGLNRFLPENNGFRQFLSAADSTGITHRYVKSIVENKDGKLFVGTSNGLNIFDPETNSFQHLFIKEAPAYSNNIIALFADRKNHIWVGTQGGFFLFDEEEYVFRDVGLNQLIDNSSGLFEIRDIVQDEDGLMWVATEEYGIVSFKYFDNGIQELQWYNTINTDLISNHIRKICLSKDSLWLATMEGLSIFNKKTGEIHNVVYSPKNEDGISNTSIHDIENDQSGGFWLATYTWGVNYYHPQLNIFDHFKKNAGVKNTINSNGVHGFWENRNNHLFISTGDGGLNRLDRRSGKIKTYTSSDHAGISNNNIKSMDADKNGNLWIGTYNGLNFFDPVKETFTKYFYDSEDKNSINSNQVHAVYVDEDGFVWLGFNEGIFQVFDPFQNIFQEIPGVGSVVNALYEDSKNRMWVGSSLGLKCMDRKKQNFLDISHLIEGHENQLTYINWISEDSDDNIWIGTNNSGIFLFKDDKSYNFNKSNGLNDNSVNAIIEDDNGDFWISTNSGVSKLSLSEKENGDPVISAVNFSTIHGLQAAQFEPGSGYKDSDGRIYFGGVRGYNAFFPDEVETVQSFPPVVLFDIQINFQKQLSGDYESILKARVNEINELTLDYKERNLRIRFTGINYINPGGTYYRYSLSGFEGGWIDLGTQGSLNLTYLPVGEHELKIKASTSQSEWGNEYRSIFITVMPPWWQTLWAYSLYLLTIVLLVFFFQRYSRRWAVLKNKLRLEQIIREKELQLHESKLSFFTDVSHELRTPLTLILAPLEKIMIHADLNEQLKRQLIYIQRNGNRMMHLIDKVLNLRKLESGNDKVQASQGNIVTFLREISLAFSERASALQLNFEFTCVKDEINLWFDRDKMEIIIYNLLSNAFKYTPKGGSIRLSVDIKDNGGQYEIDNARLIGDEHVEISVLDSGQGIAEEDLKHIFKRFYSDNRKDSFRSKGMGVGLELTKRMVEMQKGMITVESSCQTANRTGFTKFTVLLNSGDKHLNAEEKVDHIQSSDDLSLYTQELQMHEKYAHMTKSDNPIKLPSLGDKEVQTLLIVEDNADVRTFIRDLFSENYLVKEAVNGVEGVSQAIRLVPDLIISDIMMPEMNGMELCRLVKTDARISHIPVILLTACTTLSMKMEGVETGADEYITKPFSAQYLLLRVKNLIRQREILRSYFQRSAILQPTEVNITSVDERLLKKAMDFIIENIDDSKLSAERLSRELGLSRMHFHRKIKSLTNLSSSEFIRNIRLKRAADILQNNELSIKEVRNMTGFGNADHFRKCFKEQFQLTPSEYQKQHQPNTVGSIRIEYSDR